MRWRGHGANDVRGNRARREPGQRPAAARHLDDAQRGAPALCTKFWGNELPIARFRSAARVAQAVAISSNACLSSGLVTLPAKSRQACSHRRYSATHRISAAPHNKKLPAFPRVGDSFGPRDAAIAAHDLDAIIRWYRANAIEGTAARMFRRATRIGSFAVHCHSLWLHSRSLLAPHTKLHFLRTKR